MAIEYVTAIDGAPAPLGLYSHAAVGTIDRKIVAVAGQLAVDSDGRVEGSSLEEQFSVVMRNLTAVLAAAGSDLARVVKFTTYLIDPDDVPRFYEARSKAWGSLFPSGDYPPNTLVVVSRLVRPELRIEIEALALA